MAILPENYVINKFYELAGYVLYNRHTNVYNACCPICHEGKSWGKKRRCFYIPMHDNIYCHNCGWSSTPIKWIQYLTGKTYKEILEESEKDEYITEFNIDQYEKEEDEETKKHDIPTLPGNCINIFDNQQLNYHKNNTNLLIALSYASHRLLFNAVNRPPTLYFCPDDVIHKNRLIIPFFDENNKIIYYQSRGLLPKDLKEKPKYLSKIGAEKSIFGINNVSNNMDNIYIFEGPIDAMFVKNGIAVGGIQENTTKTYTPKQQDQMKLLSFYKKIWVLDSQYLDNASLKKSEILLENNETIFIWPKQLGTKFKDFNDVCIFSNKNEIPNQWIDKYSFSGIQGLLKLKEIKQFIK